MARQAEEATFPDRDQAIAVARELTEDFSSAMDSEGELIGYDVLETAYLATDEGAPG